MTPIEKDENPDRPRIHAPVTEEEIASYRRWLATERRPGRVPGDRLQGRGLGNRQIEDWQRIASASLDALDDSPRYELSERWLLELRKSAAEGLAKGYGEYDRAARLAPEIGADLQRLREAIECDDDRLCPCLRPASAPTEFVYSPKHQRIVQVWRCAICGDWNAK